MWYVASFIRGMTVDEALRQLSFCHKKGAAFVRDTILEAQDLATKRHNVEFKTNLWIGVCTELILIDHMEGRRIHFGSCVLIFLFSGIVCRQRNSFQGHTTTCQKESWSRRIQALPLFCEIGRGKTSQGLLQQNGYTGSTAR